MGNRTIQQNGKTAQKAEAWQFYLQYIMFLATVWRSSSFYRF